MPGVEVHAQVLEAALTGSLLSAPSYAVAVEMLAALLAGIMIALLAPVASALTLFATAALTVAAFIAASWILFSRYQMLFDATFPVLATLAVYVTLVLIGYFREQVDRRRIRSAFAQYLSPSLVEQLASSPQKLVLGGEQRNMTVLFSDVRGFTTISETYKNDPQGLTTLMNRFLTPVTNAIVARNGTIDKYMGDAVMAFWNAPLDDPAHQRNACHAALDVLARVTELNRVREQEASTNGHRFVPIKMGIGINSGTCAVGNMGSDLRFQYTVMGDSVNLASRLEGQTKGYGLSIIIGAATAAAAAPEFALLEIELAAGEGQDRAGGDLHDRGRRRGRADAGVQDAAGPLVEVSGLLPQAGLDRRAAGDRGLPERVRAVRTRRPARRLCGTHRLAPEESAGRRLGRRLHRREQVALSG